MWWFEKTWHPIWRQNKRHFAVHLAASCRVIMASSMLSSKSPKSTSLLVAVSTDPTLCEVIDVESFDYYQYCKKDTAGKKMYQTNVEMLTVAMPTIRLHTLPSSKQRKNQIDIVWTHATQTQSRKSGIQYFLLAESTSTYTQLRNGKRNRTDQ